VAGGCIVLRLYENIAAAKYQLHRTCSSVSPCVCRLTQLQQLGHSVDKVEFIVMGGTFMCLPEDYRDYFIRNLHDALSGHTSGSVREAVR